MCCDPAIAVLLQCRLPLIVSKDMFSRDIMTRPPRFHSCQASVVQLDRSHALSQSYLSFERSSTMALNLWSKDLCSVYIPPEYKELLDLC